MTTAIIPKIQIKSQVSFKKFMHLLVFEKLKPFEFILLHLLFQTKSEGDF